MVSQTTKGKHKLNRHHCMPIVCVSLARVDAQRAGTMFLEVSGRVFLEDTSI